MATLLGCVTTVLVVADVLFVLFMYFMLPEKWTSVEVAYTDNKVLRQMTYCKCAYSPFKSRGRQHRKERKSPATFKHDFAASILTRPSGRIMGNAFLCSGAVVAPHLVLTTFKCVYKYKPYELMVRVKSANRLNLGILYDVDNFEIEDVNRLVILITRKKMDTVPIPLTTDFTEQETMPVFTVGWEARDFSNMIQRSEYRLTEDCCKTKVVPVSGGTCQLEPSGTPVVYNNTLLGVVRCIETHQFAMIQLNCDVMQEWMPTLYTENTTRQGCVEHPKNLSNYHYCQVGWIRKEETQEVDYIDDVYKTMPPIEEVAVSANETETTASTMTTEEVVEVASETETSVAVEVTSEQIQASTEVRVETSTEIKKQERSRKKKRKRLRTTIENLGISTETHEDLVLE